MAEIKQSKRTVKILHETMECCKEYRHEFIMPEHLLLVLTEESTFSGTLSIFHPIDLLIDDLEDQLDEMESMPEDQTYEPEASAQMAKVIEIACQQVANSSAEALDIPHLVMGILSLKESWACYLLKKALGDNESQLSAS